MATDTDRPSSTVPDLSFRPASPGDAAFVAPLMYDIARRDFDPLFGGLVRGWSACNVVERFYVAPGGMFSWANTEIALSESVPVGFLTSYRSDSQQGGVAWLVRIVLGLGPRAMLLLAWHSLIHKAVFPRHLPGSLYIAFAGVDPAYRSRGVGSAMLSRSIAVAHASGIRVVELDVDFDNPRALALYERLGFRVIRKYRQRRTAVTETWRMMLRLDAGTP